MVSHLTTLECGSGLIPARQLRSTMYEVAKQGRVGKMQEAIDGRAGAVCGSSSIRPSGNKTTIPGGGDDLPFTRTAKSLLVPRIFEECELNGLWQCRASPTLTFI